MNRIAPIVTVVVTVVVTCVAFACGGSPPSDNTTTTKELIEDGDVEPSLEDSRAKVDRMSALYAELGNGADAAGSDCGGVATAIKAWTAANEAEVARLNGELATMPADHVKQLSPTLESAMRRAVLQLKDGSDRCPGHQGVFDAISGLPR